MPKISNPWSSGCCIKPDTSNVVDLTHRFYEGMTQPPFYPPVKLTLHFDYDKGGSFAYYVSLLDTAGTHIQSAAHMVKGTQTIDTVPINNLIAPAVVIDQYDKCQKNPDTKLTIADIQAWEARYGRIPNGSWLIQCSGWSDRWDKPTFFNPDKDKKTHFPGFDPAMARWLIETDRHVAGIATECMSPEGGSAAKPAKDPSKGISPTENIPVRDELLPVWQTLVIQNMANVRSLPEAGSWLIIGAMPYRGAGGGQSRIFGVLPQK